MTFTDSSLLSSFGGRRIESSVMAEMVDSGLTDPLSGKTSWGGKELNPGCTESVLLPRRSKANNLTKKVNTEDDVAG